MYERLAEALRKEALEAPGLSPNGYTLMREAADFIDDLVSALNHADEQIVSLVEAAEKRRWVSVKERMPEKFENVIVANRRGKQVDMDKAWWNGSFFDRCGKGSYGHVTHWMPLPTPPKEDEE